MDFTDGTTTNTAAYHIWYVENNPRAQWTVSTVGISDPSGVFTADTIHINSRADGTTIQSSLAGFIITDQPVVTRSYPDSVVVRVGDSFVLSASVVGINTLSYQWQKENTASPGTFTNVPGATFLDYTNSSAAAADSGNYRVQVTGSLFPTSPATGGAIPVTVVPPHAPRTATWDGNTSTTGAQDGSGTWSYALVNWWSGSADDFWNDTDSAVFGLGGAGPYTVILGNNITANAITFNSGGYTITNSSNQTLTLGSAAGITANAAATIGAPLSTTTLSTTNMFLKAGAGALTLSGALSCDSNIFVKVGSLEVLAKKGDSPYIVTNGATLKIGYTTPGSGYANTALQIYGDGAAATTGFYLKGGQTYNCSGQMQLLNAPTTLRQYGTNLAGLGTFDINGNGLWCTAAASGSVIDTNIQMITRGYGMSAQIDAGANTATGDLIINGPLSIPGSYGFVKRGTGSLRLNAAATAANVGLDIRVGSAICGINNCIGANAILKVAAGSTFDFNGSSQAATNASLAGTVKMTINKGGTPKSTVLTTTDAANALSLGGNLTVTNIGGALVIGDSFTLFNNLGGYYNGAFASLTLPPLGDGQAWQDNTAVDGTIKVIAGSVPPSIITDLPTGTTYAYVGASPTLSVVASGDPILHYHWLKNGTTPVGTDSATLTLSSVTTLDTGDYSVTVSNPYTPAAQSATHHLTVVAVPSTYAAAVIQDAPLAYWPLNETSGTTALDYAGGYDGIYQGSPTLGVAGATTNTGTAVGFDGASQNILVGNPARMNFTGQITIEAWVKPTATDGIRNIVEHGFSTSPNGEVGLRISGGSYQILSWDGSSYYATYAVPAGDIGNWVYLAGTYDGVAWTLYHNGVQVARSTNATGALLVNGDWAIASSSVATDPRYFAGDIDEVAIYNHALSPARISNHALTGLYNSPVGIVSGPGATSYAYVGGSPTLSVAALGDPVLHYQWKKNGTTPIGTDSPTLTLPSVTLLDSGDYSVTVTNLVGSAQSGTNHLTVLSPSGYPALVMPTGPTAYWPLGEAAGPTAVDYAGNFNATYNGGVTYSVPGPVGTVGVTLDGLAGTKIVAPYSAALNPSGSFTIECWINPLDLTAGNRVLVADMINGENTSNGNDRSGWILRQNGATLQFLIGDNATAAAAYSTTVTTPAVLTAGIWQYVAATYNSATLNVTIWVNGTQVWSQTAAKQLFPNFAAPVIMGDRGYGGWRYNGSINQVALYSRLLSSQEIQSHALDRPILKLATAGSSIVLTWPTGTLQAAPEVTGTYTNVPSATSPWPVTPAQARTFYRLMP